MNELRQPLILIVDDNVVCSTALAAILYRLNIPSLVACNAKQVLSLIEKVTVDLVLTDIQMPDMTGVELAKKIKGAATNIPVVAVSSVDKQEIISDEPTLFLDVLKKPADVEKLKLIINQIINGVGDEVYC